MYPYDTFDGTKYQPRDVHMAGLPQYETVYLFTFIITQATNDIDSNALFASSFNS